MIQNRTHIKRLSLSLLLATTLLGSRIQVLDQSSGSPLPGVNITVVGTSEGLNTDLEGYFELTQKHAGQALKFSYIGYQDTTLDYASLRNLSTVKMSPAILGLAEIEVVSSKLEWEQTDLPSIVTVLRTRELLDQGNLEIKEVLKRDPSVVIDESSSGEHEISIRGSNANEVMILFDGIPLNSSYQGGFDLSWLDLNDIESISIIKGGGTLRYGSGAFGGVVVIEPLKSGASGLTINAQKTDKDLNSFSISDILQVGKLRTRLTYSSREHLPSYYNPDIISKREFLNAFASYSLRDTSNTFSFNHMDISEKVEPSVLYVNQSSDQYSQIKYAGKIGVLPNMMLQYLQRSNSGSQMDHLDDVFQYDFDSDERTDMTAIENKWVNKSLVNFMRLEFKQDRYESLSQTRNLYWDWLDQHEIELDQDWFAFTDIFKYRTPVEVPFVDYFELNASYRFDQIDLNTNHVANRDGEQFISEQSQRQTKQISKRNGFTLNKSHQNLKYQFFYSSGTSLRYPTMSDLYLREVTTIAAYMDTSVLPELNSSSEVGVQASLQPKDRASLLENMDIQASLFRNRYIDKIYYRQIPRALPTPVNFAGTTQLNGYELSILASFWKDRVRLFAGTSRLDISSYTIFPNKPEFKDVIEFELNGRPGNFRLQYFHEGQQFYTGTMDNMNWEVIALEGRENINLYASLKVKFDRKQYVVGFSALNLLSNEDEPYYLNQRKWILNLGASL